MIYLDSSAVVKLVVAEPESQALRRYVARFPQRSSSLLARVEVLRAVRPHGAVALRRAREVLRGLDLVRLDDEVLEDAATLNAEVRSLDAIHLAAARVWGDELLTIVTYDDRMARAAGQLGMSVEQPR